MAINIGNKPNVTPAGGDFEFAKIKDETTPGANDGVPVNDLVYGDFHQFFAKIIALAGITYNNLQENLTNGYQYVEALTTLFKTHGAWQSPSYVNNHADHTDGDFSGLRYRKLTNGMLQISGSFERSSVTAGIVFTLSSGFRPLQTLPIIGRREDNSLVGGSVNSSGVVTIFLDTAAPSHLDINVIMPLDLPV